MEATPDEYRADVEPLWAQYQAQREAQPAVEQECDNCTELASCRTIVLELPQGGEWIDLMVCPRCAERLAQREGGR